MATWLIYNQLYDRNRLNNGSMQTMKNKVKKFKIEIKKREMKDNGIFKSIRLSTNFLMESQDKRYLWNNNKTEYLIIFSCNTISMRKGKNEKERDDEDAKNTRESDNCRE